MLDFIRIQREIPEFIELPIDLEFPRLQKNFSIFAQFAPLRRERFFQNIVRGNIVRASDRRLLHGIKTKDMPEPIALGMLESKRKLSCLLVACEQNHASAFSIVACRQYICN